MRRFLLALGGVVVLLASGCGGAAPARSAPTIATDALPTTTVAAPPVTVGSSTTTVPVTTTTTVPDTTTTTVPDTRVVPSRITPAYVDAVLVKLNHIYGDAVRSVVHARKVTLTTAKYLGEIYSPELANGEGITFLESVKMGLSNVRDSPGDPKTKVIRLIAASHSCIFAKVITDINSETVHPVKPPADEFLGLRRAPVGSYRGSNDTPWVIFFDGISKVPTTVPDQC
jgi:hypothetical protein